MSIYILIDRQESRVQWDTRRYIRIMNAYIKYILEYYLIKCLPTPVSTLTIDLLAIIFNYQNKWTKQYNYYIIDNYKR